MRNLIGFRKLQEPMGLQMVEGPGGRNPPRFYGEERGLRRASEPRSQALCPSSLAAQRDSAATPVLATVRGHRCPEDAIK